MSPQEVKRKDLAASKTSQKPTVQSTERDVLSELRSNGKWAAGITVFSFMYGDLTVASQLPPDRRQDSWLLMQSPYPTLIFSFLYIAVVTWWGPLYMKSRKPISGLKPLMIAYNAFQVVFSIWLFYESGVAGWFFEYKLICEPCDFSNNPQPVRMMHTGYWYLVSKFIDFIDTLFFVLHKKYEHISVLHVSHHALMPPSVWYGIRYQPGGHGSFMGFLNAFVHAVMYSYYLLAAMGPRVRPFLWWKKYLTTLQMVQFTVVFFHAIALAFVECDVPPVLLRWLCGFAIMFFVLFTDFYIKAYRKRGISKGDGLPNVCYIGSPSGASNSASKSASNKTFGDVRNRKPEGINNGIRNGLPNGVAQTSSNGGVVEFVSSHSPPHLKDDTRLRNR